MHLISLYPVIMFSVLFMLCFPCVSAGHNPCKNISIGSCIHGQDSILESHTYNLDLCHHLCKVNDKCQFWRHDHSRLGSSEECLFLSADHHQVIRGSMWCVNNFPLSTGLQDTCRACRGRSASMQGG